jgi:hypothetical protein
MSAGSMSKGMTPSPNASSNNFVNKSILRGERDARTIFG